MLGWMDLHDDDSCDRPEQQHHKLSHGRLWAAWLKKKQAPFADEAPKHRTGMGEYVVPEMGKPLTSQVLSRPGPADYVPEYKLVESSAPEWSIAGRDERLEKIAGPFKAGPANYNVTSHVTGKGGPKYTIPKARKDNKATVGPMNSLVTPQDIPGFASPGPSHYKVKDPTATRAPVACFTNTWSSKADNQLPAPSDYFPTFKDKIPGGPSLGAAYAIKEEQVVAPAPNTYNIKSHMGEGPAYSISLPLKKTDAMLTPGFYMREREYSHKEKIAMHTLLPEPSTLGLGPGPAKYNLQSTLLKGAGATIKGRFPYVADIALSKQSPGPAAYSLQRLCDPTPEKIGPDFGCLYLKLNDGARPAPWDHGEIDCAVLSTKPRAPAYTMAPRLRRQPEGSRFPGPDSYTLKPADEGRQWTMMGRPDKRLKQSDTPGPSDYLVKEGATRRGVSTFSGFTMKSRHSPYVYLGFS